MPTYGPPSVYTVSMIPGNVYDEQSAFDVPEGFVWIVTDIDVTTQTTITGHLGFADGFEGPEIVAWYRGIVEGPGTFQWRGRWALTSSTLWFGTYGDEYNIQATGYQLLLPTV